jgi:hypothetical protein
MAGRTARILAGWCVALVCTAASPASAQWLRAEPVVLGNGRVTLSGDVSVTASCSHSEGGPACGEDSGFFNYSDYENSTLRMLRAGLSTSVRISGRLTALGEIRLENAEPPRPYGFYLRYRPFDRYDFDIQAGRIPATFGAFARRAYSSDNLLIGYPLAYQYLTSLRPDALPATPDDLLRMRARGWLSSFPIGDQTPSAGLPIADTFRWDTGVQLHGGTTWLEAAASVTTGSLSNPLFRDDNAGKHVAARVQARPFTGLVVGLSGSRAPYVTSSAASLAGAATSGFVQQAAGADIEYSRDHYLVRFETVVSTYDLATIEPRLRARAAMVEGRYKLTPRVHVAARLDHLGFSTITGSTRTTNWDAPVTRWELGGGYAVQRNAQVRLSVQHNTRDGGRIHRSTALSTQLLYWF